MPANTQLVAQDAQAGLFNVLMPYKGFLTDYNGVAGTTPIMFTEGGEVLDTRAGDTGYSPSLVDGLDVPMGARMIIWLPLASFFHDGLNQSALYNWSVIWRVRNVRDYLLSRVPYHFPKQGLGANNQVVVPACYESVVYQDPAPLLGQTAGGAGNIARAAFQAVNVNVYQPQNVREATGNLNAMLAPLLPNGGTGVIQQGIPAPNVPVYVPIDVTALGDELLIACTKADGSNWQFTGGPDDGFRQLFGSGSPDLGVYVNVLVPSP